MKNKIFAVITAATMLFPQISIFTVNATDPESRDVDALQYTYEIVPLIEPFNEYFYVKTDNPHPESFRFSDKDSPSL